MWVTQGPYAPTNRGVIAVLLRSSVLRALTVLVLGLIAPAVYGVPSSDTLLPANTKGFLSVTDVDVFASHWEQTQLGHLMRDPSMQPFLDDAKKQIRSKFANVQDRLGLTLDDLDGVASGEVSLSLIPGGEQRTGVALIADVTEHLDRATALLRKLNQNLVSQQAKKSVKKVGDTELTVYVLPPSEGTRLAKEVAIFLKDGLLCSTSSADLSEQILGRLSGDKSESLAGDAAYRAVMQRCQKRAGGLTPDVRWFIEPFGFARAFRKLDTKREKKRLGRDAVEVLSRQGFDAIQGVGGFVNFHAEGKYEILHRTAIYAPPIKGLPGGQKYRLAMRMLAFAEGQPLTPQAWIPRDVATYISFRLDIQKAFDASEPILDELVIGTEGGFKDALRGIKEDKYGPQVDIRNDLVAHLGGRVTAITSYQTPITPTSERFLVAIETRNQAPVARAIDRLMETDSYARRHDYDGHVIWEIAEDVQQELPELEIPLFDEPESDEDDEEAHAPSFPNSVVCIADGHLFFASDIELLKRILGGLQRRERLAEAVDFNLMRGAIDALVPGQACICSFSRTDEEYRASYELLRQGRMPESKTILGRVLNELLAEDEELMRPQKIDGSRLPSFEMVRRYFGPARLEVHNQPDGWLITGVLLNKEAPLQVAAKPADTRRSGDGGE